MRTANQHAFTWIAPLRDWEAAEAARRLLGDLADDALAKLDMLHQARFAVLDESRDPRGEPSPPCLLFVAHYDGRPADFESALAGAVATHPLLLALLEYCERFDEEEGPPHRRVERYLAARKLEPHAFFVSARGRSVRRILEERRVCERLRDALDGIPEAERPTDPLLLHRRLREAVGAPLDGTGGPGRWDRISYSSRLALTALAVLVAVCAILVVPPIGVGVALGVAVLIAWLRVDEERYAAELAREQAAETDTVVAEEEDRMIRRRVEREDQGTQNELTAVTWVRPGWLRLSLLRVVLWGVDLRASYWFTRGLLHGVPTIHFAHWLVFDRGRRLLFVSHYDGSFASYLDDFIAHAPSALTAIWANCAGFPPAHYLVFEGARDGPGFKAFARRHQAEAGWFYSAYPDLSTEEINRNAAICDGLWARRMDREQARAWRRLL